MPWYLYIALRQLFPSGRVMSFFTLVSILGVMLGVALLIIVISVMNGFGHEIRSKIVDTQGHVRIETGGILYDYQPVMEVVRSHPSVAGVAPFAFGIVMVQFENRPDYPFIQGVDLAREGEVVRLEEFLIFGRLEDLDDDSLFLSSELLRRLGVRPGQEIEVYSPLLLERLTQDTILLPRSVRVAGVFETGWNQIDANTMIGTLRLMQDLYGLEDGIHGLKVRLHPGQDPDTAANALSALLGPSFRVLSWLDTNRDFLFVLQLEKTVLFFLLLFIIVVAAFAITSSLLITVVRKTREIGLWGALGAVPREVAAAFCLQGFVIGCVGTLLGFGFGFLALFFRNDIVQFFARLTQSEAALVRFYQFTNIPVHYLPSDLLTIALLSIVVSTLAGLIPAWRAARLHAAEALRHE